MKKILLIGHGPKIQPSSVHVAFPQLRTWSLERYLGTLGHDVHTVYVENKENPLPQIDCDVAITAGPFASAYAALSLPDDVPLWLDWPSDPRADFHARLHSTGLLPEPAEQAFVTMLHNLALRRADAVGVISKRQYWATLSSMLDWSIHDAQLQERIWVTPIAFDFPFPKPNTQRTQKTNIALAGSINSWFDTERAFRLLHDAIQTYPKINVHIFGGRVQHHIDHKCPLQKWSHSLVHHHGWLSNDEFYTLLCKQDIGFWTNRAGVEPLLGSRTRALLFAWMGMDITATCDTELMKELHIEGLVWDIRSNQDLFKAISEPSHSGALLHEYCQDQYSPSKTYAPIKKWLQAPRRRASVDKENLSQELYRLRNTIQEIHNSTTWKWGSRIHKFLKKFS